MTTIKMPANYTPLANSFSDNDGVQNLAASLHTSQATQSDVNTLMLEELRDLKEISRKLAEEPPLKSQAIWNFILQFFGLVAGSLFGVFAVLAWKEAKDGNAMTATNNDQSDQQATIAYAVATDANDIASRAYTAAESANTLASLASQNAATGVAWASAAFADSREANKLALLNLCQSMLSSSTTTGDNALVCSAVESVFSESILLYAYVLYSIDPLPVSGRYTTATTDIDPFFPAPPLSLAATGGAGGWSSSAPQTFTPTTTDDSVTSTSTSDGAGRPSPTGALGGSRSSSPSTAGIIAGGVIGGLVALIAIVGLAYLPYTTYKEKLRRSRALSRAISVRTSEKA